MVMSRVMGGGDSKVEFEAKVSDGMEAKIQRRLRFISVCVSYTQPAVLKEALTKVEALKALMASQLREPLQGFWKKSDLVQKSDGYCDALMMMSQQLQWFRDDVADNVVE
ncbi:hypothetical protein F0562_007210 [Nyssa sinensis]|uniref:Uncharacterized protein n=1 Tax=Nyssa sinensis TaxID=561372 RepID=A0A5J5A6A2_9ASTE|nr:hypothetical protein F0562_007210 [Nyssa sinensis]